MFLEDKNDVKGEKKKSDMKPSRAKRRKKEKEKQVKKAQEQEMRKLENFLFWIPLFPSSIWEGL